MNHTAYSFPLLALCLFPIGLTAYFIRDYLKSKEKRIPDTFITFWILVYGIFAAVPLIVQPILFASALGTLCHAIGSIACTFVFLTLVVKDYREQRNCRHTYLDELIEDIILHSVIFVGLGLTVMIISVVMNTVIWLQL